MIKIINIMSRFSRAKKIHFQTVEGRRSVLESMRSDRKIEKLLIFKNIEKGKQIDEIIKTATNKQIEIIYCDLDQLDRQSHTKKHQGIIAVVPDPKYYNLDEILETLEDSKNTLFIILDGLEDPQNFGAISRTAEAIGVESIIIPQRRSVSISPGSMRASAGALEHIKVCKVTNLNNTINHLKSKGFTVYGLDGNSNNVFTKIEFTCKSVIVIGSEGKGISSLVKKNCDQLISIPMSGKIESLNASVSASIVMYEYFMNYAEKK
ncbi:MAG: 23S rRNA (guanosine(2251)-2'-O)-methyltransferase RlmB [Chloroflexi bacterium]|nr:23S rRNA (guanosine(2251)-2'-O)-methyltransferase RlmB [Chloroflexota bacterium]|tara:strand:- start:44823 stop:45614 length:792 start_codon:yes stop_codon:yes gene_type:complete